MKRCPQCNTEKSVDHFHKNRSQRDGLNVYCKPCWNEICRRRKLTPEGLAIRRDWHLRHKYGLTLAGYDDMLAAQGGVCAICKGGPGPGFKVFVVDHDHACCPGHITCGNCIRGLLCNACNLAVSYVEGTDRDAIDLYLNQLAKSDS